MNGFHYLYTQITNLKDMQDVNHLKMVLVEQKKGGIHDLDNKKFVESVSKPESKNVSQ